MRRKGESEEKEKEKRMIREDRMEMLRRFSALTGCSVKDCIDEALYDWLRIKQPYSRKPISQIEKHSANVVCIDTGKGYKKVTKQSEAG